jgi:molybdate transport system substrate-binding protein
MARRTFGLTALALILCTNFAAPSAFASELKIFASRAVATVLDKVGPDFEKMNRHKLGIVVGLSSELVERINAGEAFDVIAVPPPVMDRLIKAGKVVADSKVNLVRSANGVEVRAGAPKPDISSVEAFRRTLLNAKSIAYLPVPGIPQMIERLGLKDAIASKVTVPKGDIVSELVAKGEVELGLVAITQILTTPGVQLVGPLPSEIQFYTRFAGAVSSNSKAPEAARDLLKFLKGETAIPVIKAQGMEPI